MDCDRDTEDLLDKMVAELATDALKLGHDAEAAALKALRHPSFQFCKIKLGLIEPKKPVVLDFVGAQGGIIIRNEQGLRELYEQLGNSYYRRILEGLIEAKMLELAQAAA